MQLQWICCSHKQIPTMMVLQMEERHVTVVFSKFRSCFLSPGPGLWIDFPTFQYKLLRFFVQISILILR